MILFVFYQTERYRDDRYTAFKFENSDVIFGCASQYSKYDKVCLYVSNKVNK